MTGSELLGEIVDNAQDHYFSHDMIGEEGQYIELDLVLRLVKQYLNQEKQECSSVG